MHTKTTKTLFAIGLRTISVLMILSMLLANVGITPAHAASTVTISGSMGVTGAGATITANGNSGYDDSTAVANSSGNYSVTVDTMWFTQRWSGTVTPSKAGYTFSPSSRTYSSITTNQTGQDYTPTQATYTISGTVGSTGGGATITWDGTGTGSDGSTTANASTGNYSFTIPYGWSGTVTPSKTGATFVPVNRTYSNVTANDSNENYTATLNMATISGNAGVGSATITYTGGSTTSNSSGDYSFNVALGWSGTVTPSRTGFAFWPASRNYTNVTTNQTTQNYTARPTSFTFGSFGDSHAYEYFPLTADQLASLNPAIVIGAGDIEDQGFATTEMNTVVSVLKSENLYNKTFLVRGNHDDNLAGSAAGWESYFETSPNIPARPAYVANKVSLNSSSDNLTYSFDYGNSIFIGLDVPGDVYLLDQAEIDFLNARLTYAENAGLTHAFIYFHGPEYCVEQTHCTSSARDDSSSTPPALMNVINNHPIVSATFHGHEHVMTWTHMDNTRVSGLTRSYEQFVTSPSGAGSYDDLIYPDRVDAYVVMADDDLGFATIGVNGLSFTVNFYKQGTTDPVWSHTFSKINTPPTISNIADQTTNEDTATAVIPFAVGDVELNPDYLSVTAASSDLTLVPAGNISLAGSGADRTIAITPAPNQSGTATITVSVNDGNVTVDDTFVLTVSAVNDVPVADAQSLSMAWNTSVNIVLTGSDVEGSPLTFDIVDDPDHGSLSGSDANRTYTPTAGYSGTDTFTFKANDGTADSLPATVSINVTAYFISGNAGVAGATLSYTDGTPKTVTADGAGNYSFQVPIGWSGVVTPSKAGFNFTPSSMSYVDVQADQTAQNYATSDVMLTISGNAGVAGATLSYTDGTPKTATADGAGMYSLEVPYNWSGTVTPSLAGYGFRPGSRTYASITTNQDSQDYTTTTARVYYVDKTNPSCTDTGQIGSWTVPFCTITRGAYLAQPGQVVHVLRGSYAETVYPERSGTEGSPITYWADPGVVVTGRPETATTQYSAFALGSRNYIVIDGFTITNTSSKGIYVDASHHVTITNNHVSYAGFTSILHPYEQGIYTRNTSYSTISNNITDYNTCIGIRIVGGDHNLISNNTSFENFSLVETDAAGIELTGSSYNTIINNLVYSNEDSGINLYYWDGHGGATNNLVIGNLSYENGDHGIDSYQSPNNTIIGNTIQGNGTVGINFEGNTPALGSFGSIVANNIMSQNGTTPPSGSWGGNLRFDANSTAGAVTDYNLFYRTNASVQIIWNNLNYTSLAAFKSAVPTQEVNGLDGNPLFVNPVAPVLRQTGVPYNGMGIFGNYYTSPGSPAIDSANADALPRVLPPFYQDYDIDGNSRIDDPGTPNTGSGVRAYDDRGAYEYLPAGPSLPVVTTQTVTGISTITATGNGNLTATGLPNPTQHGVVWSTTANPTTDDNKTTDGPLSMTGAFTSSMTGLIPGTLYHVRAYATNDVGTAYGEDVTFTAYLAANVTTQAVTNITTTTATGNGNVTSLGVPNPTQHGMVWSTSPNPTTADNKTSDGPVSAIGAFTSSITGLTPSTLYYIRAYVTNAAGTVYGSDFTFTTHGTSTVTTQAVTNITTTTAIGNGNVTVLGIPNPTQHGIVWSTSPNPTTAGSKTTDGPLSATGAFTSNMTGLTPGTLYYVRAYVTNEVGTVYGEEVTFTALQVPTVTTQAATNITTTTATGNGNITVLGVPNPTEHGLVWSTLADPTILDNKTTNGPVSVTGTFISSITGLIPGTIYHVRAYATNAAGTSYGNDVTFTTHIVPTVTTQAVTNILQTTATGNGNITALGVPNPTEHGVVWSTSADPTTADSKTTDGTVSATGAFTSSILGLTPGTLYHVRAYATNAAGTVYGNDVSFTTLLLPTVTTQPVTAITTTTATGNGNVMALGIPNPTQHGVVWSTSLNPTTADSKTSNGAVSATGAFTGNITGLTQGTLYHVRAYATNAAGTVYGEDVTFTTLLTPTVTTQPVTEITQTTATGNGEITVLGSSNPTEHGFVWSTSPNPTTADNKTTGGAVSAIGTFSGSITGLIPGTLYHVRAYATNTAGTSYGNDVTFTTLLLPAVTTQDPTDITQNTATGNGNVTILGIPNPTEHGMVWSTSPNPTTADSKTTDGAVSATGAFTSNMTGLTIGTQYYVRAYATNAAGTVYGNEVTFTTVATSTGTTTPLTNAGAGANVSGPGSAIWLNPGYITADDTNYAQVTVYGTTSQYLQGTNYGFAIPANGTINGIQVTIGRFESGQQAGNDVRDTVVRLLKDGAVVGDNKAAASTEWPTAEANGIYGSNSDLWGTTWTAADINASNFGVVLAVNSANNRIAYVDTMQIAVTYTVMKVGSITSLNCGAGTPVATYGSSITCVVTVTRGSGVFTPSGDVTWTTNGSGSFVTSPCTLAGTNGTSTCSVSYTPNTVGTGSHLITANYAGDQSFYASSGSQTVTVNKKNASVTPNNADKTYGDTDPALTGTLTGFLPADNVTASYSRVAGETVLAGPYVISTTLTPVDVLANYNITYNTAEFTINKKAASVTPNAAGKIYGDVEPTLTGSLTGFLPADLVTATYSRVAGETVANSPYTISAVLSPVDVLGNYNVTYNTADFTISKKDASVTPNAAGKIYGDVEPTLTGSLTGFLPADFVTATYSRVEGETVAGGPYTISAVLAPTGVLVNYNILYNTADFTITPKPITVTAHAGQAKVFGAADPTFTYTSSDPAATFSGALDRAPGVNVGNYAIGQGTLAVVGGNYSMSFVSSDFSITAMPITITPDAGQSKTFGASDPLPFTYTHTALVGEDVISGTLGRVPGESIGTYAYTLDSLDAGTNYALSMASDPATFSITGKTITITPDAGQTKVFGADDPVFTYTHTPLDGEDVITGTLGRLPGEDAATYAYTLGSLDAGPNYTLIMASSPETFAITAKPITVTANAGQSKVLGAVDPTFTYTSSDPAALFTGALDREAGEALGSYAIGQGTLDAGTNYVISFISSLFTITPPLDDYTLTLTPNEHGTIVADPSYTYYHYNDMVTLTATANPGWAFENWTGDLISSNNPDSVIIHGNTTITANYAPVSVAPSFTSTPVTGVAEDALYEYNITATDPNIGDILTISATTKPAWLSFIDNGDGTAALTGAPTNADVGSHAVVLRVSDGILLTDQSFSILVTNTNDDPSFTSSAVTSAVEDTAYIYNITTTDIDAGATLTITAPAKPEWLTLTDNGDGTATLTGTPTNANVGINNVTLRVNDGTLDVDQGFTIDVGNTNDGPSFTSTPVTGVDEDSPYTYSIIASDPDTGDNLTITASTLPAWLTLTPTGNGRASLTGTPTNDEVGDHAVVLQVSDSIELASQPFTITVANINDAPVLTQPTAQTNEQGKPASLQLSATDIDLGDTLTYSASGLPEGLSIDTATGLISGTITGAVNTYTITAGVDDGHVGGTDSKTFSWHVTEPTYALTINTIGNGTVTKDPDQTSYLIGTEVTLTPLPATGWRLDHWSENVVDGKVTISGDTTVTVTFVQIEYTLTVNVVGNGTVTRDNPGPYHFGDVVNLTAVPDPGWNFANWSGGATGTANPLSVTITGNTTITANFTQTTSVTVTVTDANGVAQAGVRVYAYAGETYSGVSKTTNASGQAVFPLPAGSYRFRAIVGPTSYWSGTSNTCTVPGCSSDTIVMAISVTVTVADANGVAQAGVKVYAYNGATYLGVSKTTNGSGQVVFSLYSGSYRFRAIVGGSSYWSGTSNSCAIPGCSSDMIVMPAPVTVTVADANGVAQAGVKVYAYDGTTYQYVSKTTDGNGQVVLPLYAGSYRFRVILNGASYWSGTSNTCTIPGCSSDTIVVAIPVTVTVIDANGIAQTGMKVYLYDGMTYEYVYQTTNGNGQVVFPLQTGSYRFKVVIGGISYWSGTSNTCTIPGCSSDTILVPALVMVTVRDTNGVAQAGVKVYLYNGTTYANANLTTGGNGQVIFPLYAGSYRFKVVVGGINYWSGPLNTCTIPGCSSDTIVVPAN